MRCFLAIELPQAVHDRLAELQKRLAVLDRLVRWTRVEQIHLTLKFLGDVPDRQAAAVCVAARKVAERFEPFDLDIRGTGCFPLGGPARIVWAGLADPPASLLECQEACEETYAALGFKPEKRMFKPHLTIGRVRDGADSRQVRAAVQAQADFAAGRCRVTELVMFQSVLRPSGPIYTAIARAPLSRRA